MKKLGTVKWFRYTYGFIVPDEPGAPDLFVHHANIDMPGFRTFADGQRVEYNIIQRPGRDREEAGHVRAIHPLLELPTRTRPEAANDAAN